jgi:hypothetical protein
MRTRPCHLLSLACLLAAAGLVRADFLPVAGPFSALAGSTPYTAGTSLVPIAGAELSTLTALSSGGVSIGLSGPVEIDKVGSVWDVWGNPPHAETATPTVLYSLGAKDLTLTFGKALSAFGLEAESAYYGGTHPMTATFYNGTQVVGSITADIADVQLFAAQVTGTTPAFTSVNLSTDVDFGIAQIRFTPLADVPEPSSCLLALVGLGCAGASYVRKRRAGR